MHITIQSFASFHFLAGTSDLKYEWVLLERPHSDDTGSVSDLHSQTITLMHLTHGVYVFKVKVTAVGAYGEAVGNVTVKPGDEFSCFDILPSYVLVYNFFSV